jgi:hypothetical protein
MSALLLGWMKALNYVQEGSMVALDHVDNGITTATIQIPLTSLITTHFIRSS